LCAKTLLIKRLSANRQNRERTRTIETGKNGKRARPLVCAVKNVAGEGWAKKWTDKEGCAPDIDHARPVPVVIHIINNGETNDLGNSAEETLQRAESCEDLEGWGKHAADHHAQSNNLGPEPHWETTTYVSAWSQVGVGGRTVHKLQ
jgi:hypothetical protein